MRCSGILPRRLLRRGGASVVRHDAAMNRMEIPDAKPCKETVCKEVLSQVQACASQNKACAARSRPFRRWKEGRGGLQAIARDRDVAVIGGNDDRRDDAGDRLATAFGARISRGRGAQEAEVESRIQEGRWQSGLSHRRRSTTQR